MSFNKQQFVRLYNKNHAKPIRTYVKGRTICLSDKPNAPIIRLASDVKLNTAQYNTLISQYTIIWGE